MGIEVKIVGKEVKIGMRLIAAGGSPEMQEALLHPYVKTIVDILLQVQDRSFFRLIAQFLKNYEQRTLPKFEKDLEALHQYYLRRPNSEGLFITPPYIDVLKQTLDNLYRQPERKIRYQRGAILELLVHNLVCPRYRSGECSGNQRFLDERGKNITDQVDVAALSHDQHQVEGYECKIKAVGISSEDCTNLTALANAALERDYLVNVGAVSFDNDWLVENRLRWHQVLGRIKPYGLDSLLTLQHTPF